MRFKSFAEVYPDYIDMWHPDNELGPDQVSKASSQNVKWICNKCKHVWIAPPNRIHRGIVKNKTNGCPICNLSKYKYETISAAHPEIAKYVSNRNDVSCDEISYRSNKKLIFELDCGHEAIAKPIHLSDTNGNMRLPRCKICNSLAYVRPDLRNEFSDKNEKSFDNLSYNSAYKAIWECENNHSWVACVYQRVNGKSQCPECGNNFGRKESSLYEFVRSIVPDGVDIIRHDRSVLGGKEIDILIPEYKIGIEFNGVYWHGEKYGCDRNYHKNKVVLAKSKGYRIIMVWEDDWADKRDAIEAIIKNSIPIQSNDKIKDEIFLLNYGQSAEFLDKYHIDGSSSGKFHIALKNVRGSIVAVSVWKKYGNVLHLARFASLDNLHFCFETMLNYMKEVSIESGFSKIVFLADNGTENDNLYEKIGMVKNREIEPDYKYGIDKNRISKKDLKIMKASEEFHKNKSSESSSYNLNKLDKVWDCGKTQWVLEL